MSCFLLLENLCKELKSKIRQFWWDQREEENKINGMRWNNLCKPKQDCRIGFQDFKKFILAHYFPTCYLLEATMPNCLIHVEKHSSSMSHNPNRV